MQALTCLFFLPAEQKWKCLWFQEAAEKHRSGANPHGELPPGAKPKLIL